MTTAGESRRTEVAVTCAICGRFGEVDVKALGKFYGGEEPYVTRVSVSRAHGDQGGSQSPCPSTKAHCWDSQGQDHPWRTIEEGHTQLSTMSALSEAVFLQGRFK